jgi:hypothetical protein
VIPALIDLHVRPILNELGHQDVELLAVQARDRGLDGVVVVGTDSAVELGETSGISQATGVQVFAGVELDTEQGPLLCYPRLLDDWFRQAGWRTLAHAGEIGAGVYLAADVVKAFAERGGAVVGLPHINGQEPSAPPAGLAGFVVTGLAVDDRAVTVAQTARLACVGASAATPGQERFGTVATVFAAPPMTQEAMVDGLRSGRVWPAEIGAAVAIARPAPVPQPTRELAPQQPRRQDRAPQQEPPVREPPQPREPAAPREPLPPREPAAARARPAPQPKARVAKVDPFERPGDNRGNRLNREELRRKIAPTFDDMQPSFDPVAAMYGLDGRKIRHWHNKTEAELDRINGNRAKGPDPNVMVMPAFDELRQERQHINLLFGGAREEDDIDDSVALRFALSHFNGQDGPSVGRDLPQQRADAARRGRRRRR